MYYVYILSTRKVSLFYTGVTNDLIRRVGEHKSHTIPGFTAKYNCDRLMYYEEYSFIHEAISREKQLKKFRRDWKRQLIEKMNPTYKDLFEEL